jgi:hypothetical protein
MPGIKLLRVGLVNDSAMLGDLCNFVYEASVIEKVTIHPITEHKCYNIEDDDHNKKPGDHSGDVGILRVFGEQVQDKVAEGSEKAQDIEAH